MQKIIQILLLCCFCLHTQYLCAYEFNKNRVDYKTSAELKQEQQLYQELRPFDEGYLQVSAHHRIYYAQFGDPKGVPALVLHGGPMAGSSPFAARTFDPKHYRIIIFDQRGSGKSQPHGSLEENTTQDLIADIVKLKEHLNIDKWLVTGGSWGSALSLLYTQAHPSHSLGLILRGVFDGSKSQYNHLLYGMGQTFPQAYDEFISYLPEKERSDVLTAYYNRVLSSNPSIHMPAARTFVRYDTICGMVTPTSDVVDKLLEDDQFNLSISRGYFHYSKHDFFIEEKQIINNLDKIAHLPVIIVNGQHDTITPARNAYELYQQWPNAALLFVQDAGHFGDDTGIALALTAASDQFKSWLG